MEDIEVSEIKVGEGIEGEQDIEKLQRVGGEKEKKDLMEIREKLVRANEQILRLVSEGKPDALARVEAEARTVDGVLEDLRCGIIE